MARLVYSSDGNYFLECTDCEIRLMNTEYGYICPGCNHKIERE